MPLYSKPFYHLFRRNKYFFIGCFLGITLSFFVPMLEDCENTSFLLNNDPKDMITVLKLNRNDYDLFLKLEKWYREMASSDYNPILRNKPLEDNKNNNNNKELHPETIHQSAMVRDKKLKFYRPRFHSIELNVKRKLLICILIRNQFLIDLLDQPKSELDRHLIEEYINITNEVFLNDFKDDILYFYSDISTDNENNSNLVIVLNKAKDLDIWFGNHQPYHVQMLNYLISKKKINEYAFILLMTEQTLIHCYNLQQYLQMLTVSDLVLSTSNGSFENFSHNDNILNNGLLISSTLISICYDDWLCYIHKTLSHQDSDPLDGNIHYWHPSFQISHSILTTLNQTMSFLQYHQTQIVDSIFIYPISYNSKLFNLIQALIAVDSIEKLKLEIQNVESIVKIVNKDKTKSFDGSFRYQKPGNRYEVARWIYSNESHMFMPNDIQVIRPLNHEELLEIDFIKNHCLELIQSSMSKIESKITIEHLKIENWYQKFDAVRGLEYIVDLILSPTLTSHRFKILKPLNPVELLTAIPHVTENLRLIMILPVRGYQEVPLAINFLNHYANVCLKRPNHQTILIIVLIGTRNLNNSVESLTWEKEEFKRLKKVSLYVKMKFHSKIIFIDINPPDVVHENKWRTNQTSRAKYPSELVYMDLITRSLILSSDEPLLILHCRSNMYFSVEFLNRVRVNTIANNQIFIPIPFVEYRLRTTISNYDFKQMLLKQLKSITNNNFLLSISHLTADDKSKTSTYFDVRKDNGYFDETNNEFIAFYLQDYIRARKRTSTLMPIVRNRESFGKYSNLYYDVKMDLFHMFKIYNDKQMMENNGKQQETIILMRAIEPELKLFHTPILDDCDYFESNQYSHETCLHRQVYGLGPKQKLAAIVYEYIERKFQKNITLKTDNFINTIV